MGLLDPWFVENLVCPVDHVRLEFDGRRLISKHGKVYPVVDGTPVLLVENQQQTMEISNYSIERAKGISEVVDQRAPQLYLETLGISENEKAELVRLWQGNLAGIDPVVLMIIGATSGHSYKHLIGNQKLQSYPIPSIDLPPANPEASRVFLDLGCNWGRWSVAAAKKGYRVVGIDPSLGAIMAAKRVASELNLDIKYIVGDGRFLPFREQSFDIVYSYSVLQHFTKPDVKVALAEVNRTLKRNGLAKIQMANKWGVRSLQHQAKRGFRNGFRGNHRRPENLG
jgi:2-polyprenyl-3-methyl-5-hydroxy-6-metoxy-1,4-benzoquinol methylase/uncharacterized protein YbaR (Trm112 family)